MMRAVPLLIGLAGMASAVPAVVHPGEAFDEKRTVVWTPLFQTAWDEMNGALDGPPKESGSELMKALDRFDWDSGAVMPEGGWEAWAGPSTDAQLAKARKRATELFGEEVEVLPDFEPADGVILSFGAMLAEVDFEKELQDSDGHPMTFVDGSGRESPVEFFGVEQAKAEDYRRHVRVLAWRPHAGFMALELRGKERATGSVILFQPPEILDFSTACRWIRKWRADWDVLSGGDHGKHTDRSLHLRDQVRVPKLAIVSDEGLSGRLRGSRIYAGSSMPWTIGEAWQRVEFGIDEKGARVKAATAVDLVPLGPMPTPSTVPRDFIFDEPFFVFMWRDGADWPYFGAWIGDAGGMTVVE